MTDQLSEAVFWCLAAALLAVTVLLVRQRGITARQHRRGAELADRLRARDEELRHLLAVRLPAVEEAPHQVFPHQVSPQRAAPHQTVSPADASPSAASPAAAPQPSLPAVGLLDADLEGTDFARCLDGVLERFAGAVEHARSRADQSASAALKSSMRSLQALANEQQIAISEMQDRHDNPDVLRDLLEIDHTNAQFGRRAQAIAVLCGSWPGRQRAASALTEVVRGATSRVRDYRRVRIHGEVDIAVESRAVEPVVLAIAELLDNAARHSQPGTRVEVTLQTAHNGACVVIDDAGVGMDSQATEHAARALSGNRPVDVTRLGDPPQFGLAAIGVLSARYGFRVSVDSRSPYGGVRAVVFLPSALLTHPDTAEGLPPVTVTSSRPAGAGAGATAEAPEGAPAGPDGTSPRTAPRTAPRRAPRTSPRTTPGTPPRTPERTSAADSATTAGGLPKRRRRTPPQQQPAAPAPASASASTEEARSAEEIARRLGAYARGSRQGRAGHEAEQGGRAGQAGGAPHLDEGNTQA